MSAEQEKEKGRTEEATRTELETVRERTPLREMREDVSQSLLIQRWQSICHHRGSPQGDQCLLRWPNQKLSASPLVFLRSGAGPGRIASASERHQQRRCHVDRLIRQARRGPGQPATVRAMQPPLGWSFRVSGEHFHTCVTHAREARGHTHTHTSRQTHTCGQQIWTSYKDEWPAREGRQDSIIKARWGINPPCGVRWCLQHYGRPLTFFTSPPWERGRELEGQR